MVWLLNTSPQLLHHGLYFSKLEYESILYYLTEVLKQIPATPALSVYNIITLPAFECKQFPHLKPAVN